MPVAYRESLIYSSVKARFCDRPRAVAPVATRLCIARFDLGIVVSFHAHDFAKFWQLVNGLVAGQRGMADFVAFFALARPLGESAPALEAYFAHGGGQFWHSFHLLCLRRDVHQHRFVFYFEFHHAFVRRFGCLGVVQAAPRAFSQCRFIAGFCRCGAVGLDLARRRVLQSGGLGLGCVGLLAGHHLLWLEHPLLAALFKWRAHHGHCRRQPNRRVLGAGPARPVVLAQRLARRQGLVELADGGRGVHGLGVCAVFPFDRQGRRRQDHDRDLFDSAVCQPDRHYFLGRGHHGLGSRVRGHDLGRHRLGSGIGESGLGPQLLNQQTMQMRAMFGQFIDNAEMVQTRQVLHPRDTDWAPGLLNQVVVANKSLAL